MCEAGSQIQLENRQWGQEERDKDTQREEEALKERGGKKIQEGDLDWEVKIFRAWQRINSWHYQQLRHGGLAINSWMDLITSRSHTYPTHTHTNKTRQQCERLKHHFNTLSHCIANSLFRFKCSFFFQACHQPHFCSLLFGITAV